MTRTRIKKPQARMGGGGGNVSGGLGSLTNFTDA